MSDLKLGNLIDSAQQRDAIHIAVAPVVAVHKLNPGDHIGFLFAGDIEKVGRATDEIIKGENGGQIIVPIGIVDPFLAGPVHSGQQFWMILYPQTIRGLRHDWQHPAFEGSHTASPSEAWLRGFAATLGFTYEELLKACEAYQASGVVIEDPTNDGLWEWDLPDGFWNHYQTVTGKQVDDRGTIFRCCP